MLRNLEQELLDARIEAAILRALWRLGWWVKYGRLPRPEAPTSAELASLLPELPSDIREQCERLAANHVPSLWDDNVPNVDLLERMPEWTRIRSELPDGPSLAWEASVPGWVPIFVSTSNSCTPGGATIQRVCIPSRRSSGGGSRFARDRPHWFAPKCFAMMKGALDTHSWFDVARRARSGLRH